MIRLIASLVCVVLLVFMVGVYGLIEAGAYKAFADGDPFDPAMFGAMFSPLIYRKVLLAFIVAMAFAVLDIKALVSHPEEDENSEFAPKTDPLGFAALRARRYVLPVFALFYLGLWSRLTTGAEGIENFFKAYDSFVYAGLFLLSRRTLDKTIGETVGFSLVYTADLLKTFARGGGH